MHAVGRRPRNDVEVVAGDVLDRERTIERERIGGARVVVFGRDDRYAPEALHRFGERLDAGRPITVVVRNQNVHGMVGKKKLDFLRL